MTHSLCKVDSTKVPSSVGKTGRSSSSSSSSSSGVVCPSCDEDFTFWYMDRGAVSRGSRAMLYARRVSNSEPSGTTRTFATLDGLNILSDECG